MSRKIKRKIHIGDDVYYWVADQSKLALYPYEAMLIRVYKNKATKSILYIDANAAHFEMSPENIKDAIEFALLNNWDPNAAGRTLNISKNANGFYVLPEGVKHEFEMFQK